VQADLDVAELEKAAEAYVRQVSEAVAADEETQAYVSELERRAEQLEAEADLPSGDTLAAELTRFLREHEARRRENDEDSG
jgi:predicted transcriptional regulator